MHGGPAAVGAVSVFQVREQLGEIQLLVNLDQQVIEVNEVPPAFAGELEEVESLRPRSSSSGIPFPSI